MEAIEVLVAGAIFALSVCVGIVVAIKAHYQAKLDRLAEDQKFMRVVTTLSPDDELEADGRRSVGD